MAVFGDSVPREMYEDMKQQRNDAQAALERERERYGQLVQNFVDMRRHQEGMNPAGFDPSKLDPMNLMGPKTQMAIEEEANGDVGLRMYLRNRAYLLWTQAEGDAESKDEQVSKIILAGDTT